MKVDLEKLKQLVETGDVSAIENHIKGEVLEKNDIFNALDKGDIVAAASVNSLVKSDLDREKDIHFNTALGTYKEKTLPGLLEEAKNEVRKELNPNETPEQKQIRELREMLDNQLEANAKASLKEELLKLATSDEVKLSHTFISKHLDKFIPGSIPKNEDGSFDLETVKNQAAENLKGLATDFNSVISTQIEEKLKGASRNDLGGGLGGGQQKEELLGEKLAKLNNHEGTQQKLNQFFGAK